MNRFHSSIFSFEANYAAPDNVLQIEDNAVKIALLFSLAAAMSGCMVSTLPTGPVQYDSKVIERDTSENARVNLRMGAGDLKISSGTQKFMHAYFTYNVPQLKPEVRYSSSSGTGSLWIEQPSSHARLGHIKYEWDLRLNNEMPLDLDAHFG